MDEPDPVALLNLSISAPPAAFDPEGRFDLTRDPDRNPTRNLAQDSARARGRGADRDEARGAAHHRADQQPPLDPARRHHGHRVEGWVRPEYDEPELDLPAGDYWTPIPESADPNPEPSAQGYGWPVRVERLPPVQARYDSPRDRDQVECEPTEVVSTWSPEDRRVRLPRTWAARDENHPSWPPTNTQAGAQMNAPTNAQAGAQMNAPTGSLAAERTRRRPRPRPRPQSIPDDDIRYRSRHAADPPR